MKLTIRLYDDSIMDLEEAAVDPMGVTYQNDHKLILPDDDADTMHMVLIPWAAISELQYAVTPDMLEEAKAEEPATQDYSQLPVTNRKQRRAHLQ